MEKIDIYLDQGMSLVIKYGPNLVYAIVTLIVGFWIINAFVKFLKRTMTKRNVDPSLVPFTASLANCTATGACAATLAASLIASSRYVSSG